MGQFSSVIYNSLGPHGLQHARLPCPSQIPGAYSNSCPSSQWCYPTISSFVIHLSSHLQSFPASGSFQMSQFFASGGQSIRASPAVSVLPVNIQDWFPLGLTGWFPCSPRGSQGLEYSSYTRVWVLEWVCIPFSKGSSQPRDRAQVSCIVGGFFTSWATKEVQE